jgi:ligand-binding sensor domain-containing protein
MRIVLASLAVLGLAGAAFLGYSFWKASRTLRDAGAQVAAGDRIAFRRVALDRPLPAGFETIGTPSRFRDAASFLGRFYISGSGGLYEFDGTGELRNRYRVGLELPPAPVTAIAPGVGGGFSDPQLWVATAGEGLLAFDGRHFVQIRPGDAPARALTCLLPLSTGRVLLGTEKIGVLVWDGKKLGPLHPALAGLPVTALAGSEGDLWVGTLDRGVFRWHAGQLDHFSETEGVPDPEILSLAVDGNRVYAGTALGIAAFEEGRFARVLAPGLFARTLLVHGETLLAGTLEDGVAEIPLNAKVPRARIATAPSGLNAVEHLFLLDGKPHALAQAALYRQPAPLESFERVLAVPGGLLTDANISALAADRAGRLWVGYFDRGLDIVEPGLDRARHLEDDHLFCVNRIVHHEDGGGSAVATANGLALFDGSAQLRQVLSKADGLIASQVTDVLLGGTSRAPLLTIATPAGISMLDGTGVSSLYAFHGLVNNHVYALARAGSRTLAGTLGGLSILESGIVSASMTTANSGLKHNWITAIAASDNGWYIGTYGAGVVKLEASGAFTSYPDLSAPVIVNPNAIAVTSSAVYAGTLGSGLAVFNRGAGRWSKVQSGLPSMNVTALAALNGYLYIGTDNGLARAAERELPIQ